VLDAQFIDGALESLERLKEVGIPAFVVTATPEEEMKYIIKERGLDKYFTRIYGSPEQKSENIRRIINEYNYEPSFCLMIGDAINDYDAAKANGVNFSGIVRRGSKSPFLKGTTISHIVDINVMGELT